MERLSHREAAGPEDRLAFLPSASAGFVQLSTRLLQLLPQLSVLGGKVRVLGYQVVAQGIRGGSVPVRFSQQIRGGGGYQHGHSGD